MKRKFAFARFLAIALVAIALTGCSGQAELIDGGGDGASAFIAMTVLIVIFVFFLFSLDRYRKKREESEPK